MELELREISKSFGEKKVLREVSFAAKGGQAFGLLGRNGAGKTTTIRILMDVFPADGGSILIDGKPIDHSKIKIGYLPEERGMYPKKKIIDQLVYFAELKGMQRRAAIQSIGYWLERLNMAEHRDKRLDTLSKGNQQKIQLITALAHDPEIVILDEPFSGLDPVNAMLLKDVVKEEIAKGKNVLFSSHQMHYIEEFCDSVAILKDGKVALHGELSEIKHSYPRNKLVIRSAAADEILTLPDLAGQKTGENELVLTLSSPEAKKQVMKMLAERFDIDEMRVFEPSLGDIFVEYAGD